LRHLVIGLIAVALALPFWYGRLDWDPDMRFWRAVGDSSFLLLIFTMAIGPIAKQWPSTGRIVPWRRETGIWFGLMAFLHTFLVWKGWARWDIWRFLGYEFVPELNRLARLEPGFGLSNIIGMLAIFLTLVLVATSSNRAVKLLGSSAWKWVQYGSYTVFYLVVIHTLYFLFLHYTASFHRRVPETPNWFQYPFLFLILIIPVLQVLAFFKTVNQRRRRRFFHER
jgi:sulfoxide reductase heme-binding subunit YedZ